ncbi:nucleoside triphosphate pyrophosphohydrolase [Ornithobacterium rhinotracheale]|uniref:Nucleoside triphosphate pyrophosphohydrolase n=1 Tax=Ornithobacterium rhinotracheale TaxID=28251 RepID=A0A3R5XU69_ORNRH|nr:nucleoside triphosphate pyrophosphohydrolase [Ornithobacterium rhinotracheale]QAR30564.1 nucleoside triphosphate pyrophosphohydrolase [Ornithobacterium rhinotracheale]
MHTREEKLQAFGRLLDILDELREKCPWDKKQTLLSLRHLTLEEVYELGEAILNNDLQELKKEIGDVMLHLIFYAKIAEEQKAFDIADALNAECEKLIFRHPHIYANTQVQDEEEVKRNWEKLKLKEGNRSVLAGVPKGLPAMVKAFRIQDKVKGIGFDFPSPQEAFSKIEEEIAEFKAETDKEKQENELGDVLFSIINYARQVGINPENALEKTNQKFINRFQKMENLAEAKKVNLSDLSIEQLDLLWEQAKKEQNQ